MTTANKSLAQPANGSSSWDTPLNANFGIIDAAMGSLTTINVTGIGTGAVTLTDTQYQKMAIVFTGTISNNLRYNLPASVGGSWIISDQTTGSSSYTITLGSLGGGATLSVPRGAQSTVFCDASAVRFADDSRPVPPGSTTQVVYNNAGVYAASPNFTFSGTAVAVSGNIQSGGNILLSTGNNVAWGNTNIQAATSSDALVVTNSTTRFRFAASGSNTSYGPLYADTGNVHVTSGYSFYFGSTGGTYFQGVTGGDIAVVNAAGETARFLASHNFLVGTTNLGSFTGANAIGAANGYLTQAGASGGFSGSVFNISWTGAYADLWIDSTNIGQIYTTSDYRIKKNISPQTVPAISRVMALKPVVYETADIGIFKSDGIEREGFLAHELQEVIPSAVNGQKDAVTATGGLAPQSINLAPVMSVAVKAIQEMKAEIDELRIELAALKGAK